MAENIIEISHLNKSFGEIKAVQDLSFNVKEGEFFAFLGVNGAGKSTTISIMCGRRAADSGNVVIGGKTFADGADFIKREIGVVFQNSVLDRQLTVRDNLASRAALYDIYGAECKKRINELAEMLDFKDYVGRPLGKLSGGQRRRIDIARALIHEPKILILDEPTTGLDPQTRRTVWDVIGKLRKERGLTVFLTTHYMEESADADYIVILDSGKMAAHGTPLQLKNTYTGDFVTIYNISDEAAATLGYPCEKIRDAHRVAVPDTAAATKLITAHPELFVDYEVTKGRMDDVFLAVTGKKLTGGGV